MEWMSTISNIWNEHQVAILAALLGISEGLANLPWLKANSILELVVTILKRAAGK